MRPIVLDCSLRDGGYYNNWDFPPDMVRDYVSAAAAAPVDVIEIGFRSFSNGTFQGAHAFSTDAYLKTLQLPDGPAIAVMVNASTILKHSEGQQAAVEALFAPRSKSPVSLVRIAAHLAEVKHCEPMVRCLHDLGYEVGFNVMQAGSYPEDERTAAAAMVAQWPVRVLYFADSFGSMTAEDISAVYDSFRKAWPGEIGFHAHDNMLNGLSNSMAALDKGTAWVDGTVLGIGRGAGNVRMEYLLLELNRRLGTPYDPSRMIDFIDKTLASYQRQCGWGPHPLYFLAAQHQIHPTYVQVMMSDARYSTADILGALEFLAQQGGRTYRAADAEPAAMARGAAAAGGWSATDWLADREVLILGAGPGTDRYSEALEDFIRRRRPAVLAVNVNHTLPAELVTAYIACHHQRIIVDSRKYMALQRPLITPFAHLPEHLAQCLRARGGLDYGMVTENGVFRFDSNGCVIPSLLAAAYALAVATSAGARRILLAGFDGFDGRDARNGEMIEMLELYMRSPEARPLLAITPTSYPLPQGSVFAPDL